MVLVVIVLHQVLLLPQELLIPLLLAAVALAQRQQQMEQRGQTLYSAPLHLMVAVAVVEMLEPVATAVLVVVHLLLEPTQPQEELEIHLP